MEKAIKHMKWRFGQDRITINQKDIDALNEIIEKFNEIKSKALHSQDLFIKLFIENFIKQTSVAGRTSKEATQEIERLLEIPMEEYHLKMREEIPYLRFQMVLKQTDFKPLYEMKKDGTIKINNSEADIKANEKIIKTNQKLLKNALTREYSDQELQDFMRSHIFSIILKHSQKRVSNGN